MIPFADYAAPVWEGRYDGDAPEHLRWHQAVMIGPASPTPETESNAEHGAQHAGRAQMVRETSTARPARAALVGFACDAGVARNHGRVGAASAPPALRSALGSLAFRAQAGDVLDSGDIVVHGDALEVGQARLGAAVAAHLAAGRFVTVLGGGHETAYGTYCGLAASGLLSGGRRLGILNLDAHFDLRAADRPSSGTPFLQVAEAEAAAGRDFHYAVAGISRPNNTQVLFQTADRLGVRYLEDEACQSRETMTAWVEDFVAGVDLLYLTVDLDVLPAGVAPGVSAPAGYGVPFDAVRAAALTAARSGKLAVFDVVELNPLYDVDHRTARSAARLIDEVMHAVLT